MAGYQRAMVDALDYIVIVIYFAVMLGAAWWGFRRAKTADDYLVAGRRLGYPMFIGTLSAVVLGGASTIGSVSLGYQYGISGAALVRDDRPRPDPARAAAHAAGSRTPASTPCRS